MKLVEALPEILATSKQNRNAKRRRRKKRTQVYKEISIEIENYSSFLACHKQVQPILKHFLWELQCSKKKNYKKHWNRKRLKKKITFRHFTYNFLLQFQLATFTVFRFFFFALFSFLFYFIFFACYPYCKIRSRKATSVSCEISSLLSPAGDGTAGGTKTTLTRGRRQRSCTRVVSVLLAARYQGQARPSQAARTELDDNFIGYIQSRLEYITQK